MSIKLKKASEEQKEYLLNYMEGNIRFSQDKFEDVDGAHTRYEKWKELSDQLNSLGGAIKDSKKWRKFWMDQKSHIKEKEALLKASFERSGVNAPQKMKPLTEFEKRVLQLMVPAVVSGNDDVVELFNIEGNMEAEYLEDDWHQQSSSTVAECRAIEATATDGDPGPSTKQKKYMKKNYSELSKVSAVEDRLLQIEEEKLVLNRKMYKLKKGKFEADEKWRERQYDLENRKLLLAEKKFEYLQNK